MADDRQLSQYIYHRRTKSKSTYLFHVGKFMGFVVPARSCHYQQFEENESHSNHHLKENHAHCSISHEPTRTMYDFHDSTDTLKF